MSKNENLLPVLRDPQLKKYLIHKLAPKLIKAKKKEKKKKDTKSIHWSDSTQNN